MYSGSLISPMLSGREVKGLQLVVVQVETSTDGGGLNLSLNLRLKSLRESFGNLTVDFKPKCGTQVFRKNLNEVILFDELTCDCQK